MSFNSALMRAAALGGWLLAAACVGYRPEPAQGPEAQEAPEAGGTLAPRQVLDQHSGDSLWVVRRPIVLARARTDLAANAHDFLTLVAFERDHAGKYATWLLVHRWSTSEHGATLAGRALLLVADGRTLALEPAPADATGTEARTAIELLRPHAVSASDLYVVDLPTLRYLAEVHELSARLVGDPVPLHFELWSDGREALRRLLAEAVTPGVR